MEHVQSTLSDGYDACFCKGAAYNQADTSATDRPGTAEETPTTAEQPEERDIPPGHNFDYMSGSTL